MRKFIGWLVSWTLYWMGDAVSKLLNAPDWFPALWFDLIYPVYNRLMLTSTDVQDWGGAGPWREIEDEPAEPDSEGGLTD